MLSPDIPRDSQPLQRTSNEINETITRGLRRKRPLTVADRGPSFTPRYFARQRFGGILHKVLADRYQISGLRLL